MRKLLICLTIIFAVTGCAEGNPNPVYISCTSAVDHSEIRSDLADNWSYDTRGNAFTGWVNGDLVFFSPRPGDQCIRKEKP